MPIEIIRYIQCTEMYHCLPSELADEDEHEIDMQWIIRNKTAEIQSDKQAAKSGISTVNANQAAFESADTDKF